MASVARMHSLVAKNTRLFKAAWKHAVQQLHGRVPASLRPAEAELQLIYARATPKHPLHPTALLRQSKSRWYTTYSSVNASLRQFATSARSTGAQFSRASLPKSKVGSAVYASTGRAPFASTLRPNLTGGAFPRTAGGYGLGSGGAGSARYFSHTPASPAQVINNVSQGVRAFMLSGKKIQYDGMNKQTGEKRYKAVSSLQDEVSRKVACVPKVTPGSFIDFGINPTITALSPMAGIAGFTKQSAQHGLESEGLLDVLAVDFSRAIKELAGVLTDLKKLACLGDLPMSYYKDSIRIHFPGCDTDSVERLCLELDVRRGYVYQDDDFDAYVGTEIALLFPFAPSRTASEVSFYEKPVAERTAVQEKIDWRDMVSPMEQLSTRSELDLDFEEIDSENPWLSSPSGYESLHTSDIESQDRHTPLEYQGLEGIYRFMQHSSQV